MPSLGGRSPGRVLDVALPLSREAAPDRSQRSGTLGENAAKAGAPYGAQENRMILMNGYRRNGA